MAACLITITGSGSVLLRYKESLVDKSIIAKEGSLYLNDLTVTNVTFTTLSGTNSVTSSCFTITSIPSICYKISWDFNNLVGYNFVSVNLDGVILNFSPVSFPNAKYGLPQVINSLSDDRIKIVQGFLNTLVEPMNTVMIIKTISVTPPIFKIDGPDPDDSIYLIGEITSCSNIGYTNFNTCQPIPLS